MSRKLVAAIALTLSSGLAGCQRERVTPKATTPLPAVSKTTIYVQPLRPAVSATDLAAVSAALQSFYGDAVKVLPQRDFPKVAYYAPRKRWRADRTLVEMRPVVPPDALAVIGVTSADVSIQAHGGDWGILGLAERPGKTAVVSLFRCLPSATSSAIERARSHEAGTERRPYHHLACLSGSSELGRLRRPPG